MRDADQALILMHRDAHFGGDFEVMIKYYDGEGKGCHFDIDQIFALAELERSKGGDLAPLVLSGAEAEQVAAARDLYEELREVYSYDRVDKARLMSDLILAEDDEEQEAISAVVERGAEMVPALVNLLESSRFTDPLSPGYGYAPSLAARCLGRIGDESALMPLFEAVGSENRDLEEEAAVAFRHIGEPAKAFLIEILQGDRITNDTERAAYLASLFAPDPEITAVCRHLLGRPEVQGHPSLRSYLEADLDSK